MHFVGCEINVCFVPVNDTVTVFQIYKIYIFPHIYCLIFFIFLSFWMVLPPMSCFWHLVLQKAIIGSTEKFFSKALLVFKMDQWFWIICFILGSVRLYVTVSGNTWAFCVVFGVSKAFLSTNLIFSISVSVEDES